MFDITHALDEGQPRLRLHGGPDEPGTRHGPLRRGTPGAVHLAGRRRDRGGPWLWLSSQRGHGRASAGGRGGAAPPGHLPLETEAAKPFNGLRWLRQRGSSERDWHGWCRWEGRRYAVRLVAATLPPAATRRARHRTRRKAQQAGRTITAPTLAVAGWLLLITTLDAGIWLAADVLYVYRARWQVELGCKKMKQLLRLNQMRSKHRTSVEATVRALLVAWALHEGPATTEGPSGIRCAGLAGTTSASPSRSAAAGGMRGWCGVSRGKIP
jgi:hypothetical protein